MAQGDDKTLAAAETAAQSLSTANAKEEPTGFTADLSAATGMQPIRKEGLPDQPDKAVRCRLPDERQAFIHHFSVGGYEGYLTVGLYENGQPGEIFITMAKEGSTISGLMDSFATVVSLALQHGVPVKVLCDKLSHTRFEPSGWSGKQEIGYAKSLMDYMFRWLALKFLPRDARPVESASISEGIDPTSQAAPVSAQTRLAGVGQNGDAPACRECGAIMVRNGSCYRCMNCGSTSGCS